MERMFPIGVLLIWAAGMVFAPQAGADDHPAPEKKPMKPALLVIDIQNEFIPYMSEQDVKAAPFTINGAIWLFRQRGLPIIRVYHTDPKWGPAPDSEGFKFLSSIMVKDEDPKVVKNHPSGFKQTDLERMLRDLGCNAVFLCGLSSTGCVLATYHGAKDLDFDTFMIKDALIGPDAAHTNVVEDFCDTVGFAALQVMLDNVKP